MKFTALTITTVSAIIIASTSQAGPIDPVMQCARFMARAAVTPVKISGRIAGTAIGGIKNGADAAVGGVKFGVGATRDAFCRSILRKSQRPEQVPSQRPEQVPEQVPTVVAEIFVDAVEQGMPLGEAMAVASRVITGTDNPMFELNNALKQSIKADIERNAVALTSAISKLKIELSSKNLHNLDEEVLNDIVGLAIRNNDRKLFHAVERFQPVVTKQQMQGANFAMRSTLRRYRMIQSMKAFFQRLFSPRSWFKSSNKARVAAEKAGPLITRAENEE